eukprot:TRINITY_DN4824_c1_g1_i1.p1 TRINITY_DN4824_c1_g1~~TRINITY_DN4824_c1_g1_i1.p1  ORF type:complete len:637 (-),score=111.57 TRINITY_DN4824_c1_g1_i1:137-2047(-)
MWLCQTAYLGTNYSYEMAIVLAAVALQDNLPLVSPGIATLVTIDNDYSAILVTILSGTSKRQSPTVNCSDNPAVLQIQKKTEDVTSQTLKDWKRSNGVNSNLVQNSDGSCSVKAVVTVSDIPRCDYRQISSTGFACFGTTTNEELNCYWSSWTQWTDCPAACSMNNIRSRSQNLLSNISTKGCESQSFQFDACSLCSGFAPTLEQKIQQDAPRGSSQYNLVRLAYFFENSTEKFSAYSGFSITVHNDFMKSSKDGYLSMNLTKPKSQKKRNSNDTECITNQTELEIAINYTVQKATEFLVNSSGVDPNSISAVIIPVCQLVIQITTPPPLYVVFITPPVVVICLLLLLLLGVIVWKNIPIDLKDLPAEVRWQYQQYLDHGSSWKKVSTMGPTYYMKQLDKSSEEWKYMDKLYTKSFNAPPDLEILESFAIFNPTLLSSFRNNYRILSARLKNNPKLFFRNAWMLEEDSKERGLVNDHYLNHVKLYPWNNDSVVILPLVHGTDYGVAQKIASTGFAILSSLDSGWYGKGIYFTSSVEYCIPYFCGRQDPAIIVSFVIMGNVYPVIEHPKSKNSLVGAAIKSGCNAHYVVVNKKGFPAPPEKITKKYYPNEIVITQESQIVPLYLLKMTIKEKKMDRR